MNITLLKVFFLLVFIFQVYSLLGSEKLQPKKAGKAFEKALALYQEGDYDESIQQVALAIEFDSTYLSAYQLLSDLCFEKKMHNKRIYALEKVIQLGGEKNKTAYKIVAEEFYKTGNYQKAKSYFENYYRIGNKVDSIEVKDWIVRCNYCIDLINNPKEVVIEPMPQSINTLKHEYWPAISVDDSIIYFTRLIDDQPNGAFERIFYSINKNSIWADAKELDLGGIGLANEGTMCFTANGELLFFTACNRNDGFGSCDIYYSQKVGGYWLQPRNAGKTINSSRWEAQPSVSADGKELYFVSNRANGFGKKDIWKSEIKTNKVGELIFSPPTNLGASVNTIDDDYSPFIHSDKSSLYFASKGRTTLGGADLFFSKLENGEWKPAENMGFPINSRFEDDGLVISATANVAVFSSDREGSIGQSKDLFHFNLPNEFKPQKMGYLKGFVYNNANKKTIDASIEFTDLTTGEVQQVTSSAKLGYHLLIKANSVYALNISEVGFLFYSQNFNLKDSENFSKASILDFFLTPVNKDDIIVLNNVFFDFDKAILRPESEVELARLTKFLELNKSLKVEISGHTDNLGGKLYNYQLSEQRAKAIYEYLVNSIDKERLTYKGFGSDQPIETNDTEEGRAKNRRSELKIVGY